MEEEVPPPFLDGSYGSLPTHGQLVDGNNDHLPTDR